jgi:multidrug efflux pump subunit AcrB
MLQRIASAIAVMLLAIGGVVLALFLRGMHAEWGAALGFCFVPALAIVQACMVANGIAEARRLNSPNVRNACFRGTQAKFRDVLLIGLCVFVIVLPTVLIGATSGAPARFATVMLGRMVFSTAAALTVLPVLIARIKE